MTLSQVPATWAIMPAPSDLSDMRFRERKPPTVNCRGGTSMTIRIIKSNAAGLRGRSGTAAFPA